MFDEASKPAIAGETDGRSRSLTPPKAQAQTLSDLIVRQQTERMDAMQACATAVPFRLRIRFILAPILQRRIRSSPIRSATRKGGKHRIRLRRRSLQRKCLGLSAVSDYLCRRRTEYSAAAQHICMPVAVLTAAAEATGCASVK